jgi:hypothetical protein
VRGVVGLFSNYNHSAGVTTSLEGTLTSDIPLGIGGVIDEDNKFVFLTTLNVLGHIEGESEIPSPVEPGLLPLFDKYLPFYRSTFEYVH